jgi:hypothetical protein
LQKKNCGKQKKCFFLKKKKAFSDGSNRRKKLQKICNAVTNSGGLQPPQMLIELTLM